MNLADALAQSRPRVGQECSTGKLLASVDAKTRAEIQAALDDPDLSNAHLARAFTLMGHKTGDGAIQRHRARGCRCES